MDGTRWIVRPAIVFVLGLVLPVSANGQQRAAQELRDRIASDGVEAAVEWYGSLVEDRERAEELGAGAEAVVLVAREFQREDRGDELLALGHMGIALYADDPRLHYLHGEGHRLRDEVREGVQAFRRSLEVDATYQPSLDRLSEYWGAPEPPPLGDVIMDVYEEDGYLASRNRLFDLRRDFDQTGDWDFSPSGIAREVRRLMEQGRMEDALVLANLNAAVNRYASATFVMEGEVRLVSEDPESAEFAFRGARGVEGILEERAREVEAWLMELHAQQPLPSEALIGIELDHARAHSVRGEDELAAEIYHRILRVEPGNVMAREGLLLLGEDLPSNGAAVDGG